MLRESLDDVVRDADVECPRATRKDVDEERAHRCNVASVRRRCSSFSRCEEQKGARTLTGVVIPSAVEGSALLSAGADPSTRCARSG